MNYFIKNIKQILYLKRKQIIFALFAVLCSILDKNNSQDLIKAAAPAVVAAAAKGATAAKSAATAAKAAKATGAAAKTAKGAQTAAKAKNAVDTANQAKKVSDSADTMKKLNNNLPKNTNPKLNGTIPQNTSTNVNQTSKNTASNLGSVNTNDNKESNSESGSTEEKKPRTNYLMPPFVPTKMPEEEDGDTEQIMDDAASQVVKSAPAIFGLIAFVSLFLFVMIIPLMLLGVVNATSSTLSQIDCTRHKGTHCKVNDDGPLSFFSKLKNLFVYGSYGSNSEVVLKKIEETYDNIKMQYNFIISLPLLTSSMFSDAEYVDTDAAGGMIVITDKMLERVEYIYDTAMLQLIPKYNVFTCNFQSGDDGYEYTPTFEFTRIPTYEPGDTTEEEMEAIPTGQCDESTAGTQYKEIVYFFDEVLYFKRFKISEELDLIYSDFVEADKLIVSRAQTQYYIYKNLYKVDEILGYQGAPLELAHDSNVNLQTPLKGWYSITSPFGNREGEFAGMHTGIDLVSSDKNIYAAGNGVVTRSNVETEGGNVIEITHTDKFGRQYVTQYAHLSERHVNVGDTVNAGDVIGIMGDTGTMASGVHLHFAMWDKDTKDIYNPNDLFSEADNY